MYHNFLYQISSNTKFVTFQFKEHNKHIVDQRKHFNEKMKDQTMNPTCLPNRSTVSNTVNVNNYNHKELYIQTMRPNKKWHLSNYRIDSC